MNDFIVVTRVCHVCNSLLAHSTHW